jgi:hypothetical protein
MLQIVQSLPRSASPRRRRDYEIDGLVEYYRGELLALRQGYDCASPIHGIGGGIGANLLTPIAIAKADGVTSGSYYCADRGITTGAVGVTQWNDLWGVRNFTQVSATTSRQPGYTKYESTLKRRGCVSGDGVDDYLLNGPDSPVPSSTTKTSWRLVARCNGWVSDGRLIGGVLRGGTSSQTIRAFNSGTDGGMLTMTDSTWYRIRHHLSNSTDDYCQVGLFSNIDHTNLGAGDRSGATCFTQLAGAPSALGAYSIANILYLLGTSTHTSELSPDADLLLDRFYTRYYGTNVTVG